MQAVQEDGAHGSTSRAWARRLLIVLAALIALLLALGTAPASAKSRSKVKVPLPNAGDITLARFDVTVGPKRQSSGRSAAKSVRFPPLKVKNRSRLPGGLTIAAVESQDAKRPNKFTVRAVIVHHSGAAAGKRARAAATESPSVVLDFQQARVNDAVSRLTYYRNSLGSFGGFLTSSERCRDVPADIVERHLDRVQNALNQGLNMDEATALLRAVWSGFCDPEEVSRTAALTNVTNFALGDGKHGFPPNASIAEVRVTNQDCNGATIFIADHFGVSGYLGYKIDWGDGSTQTPLGQGPDGFSHQYAPGEYDVTVKVFTVSGYSEPNGRHQEAVGAVHISVPYCPTIVTGITLPVASPQIAVSPGSLDFGNVRAGVGSQTKAVSVRDIGPGPLHITGCPVTGGASSGFSVASPPCQQTLQPGQSSNFQVTFTPPADSKGAQSQTLTIMSDGGKGIVFLAGNVLDLVNISVTPTNTTISSAATQQMSAIGTFSDASTQDLTSVTAWSSSNPGAATVSNAAGSKGLVTGVAAGSTTIGAAMGSKMGSTMVNVQAACSATATVRPNGAMGNFSCPLDSVVGYSFKALTSNQKITNGGSYDTTAMMNVPCTAAMPASDTFTCTPSAPLAANDAVGFGLQTQTQPVLGDMIRLTVGLTGGRTTVVTVQLQ